MNPNKTRKIKHDNDTIYILENITKPAVLVECGFLSNYTEAKHLSTEDYQNKLAFILYSGVSKYLNLYN